MIKKRVSYMTKASKAAIESGVELANRARRADALWSEHDYKTASRSRETTFSALCDYIQKVSDIAERCADPTTTDKGRYEALQELIVRDVDPVEEMFGKDSALIGFSTDTIRNRIEAFGYKLVKDGE